MKHDTGLSYQGRVKYSESKALSYQTVKEGKNRAELRLVERAFRLVPIGSVLDVPCGGGRVSLLLAGNGYQMTAADLSEPMRLIAKEKFKEAGLTIPVNAEDVENLGYKNSAFDAIICFRLFHHFPDPIIRQRVVMELCRVSRRYVVLSYFSPHSVTSLHRRWRTARGGRKSQKHSTPLGEVERYFDAAGFKLLKNFARFRFIHTLHLAVFRREDS